MLPCKFKNNNVFKHYYSFIDFAFKIIIITILQALLAMVLVDVVVLIICYFLNVPFEVAICLGAIATATAPAATLMVIHQYNAKGPLVDLLLPVVALDDALGLIFFSISVSISIFFSSQTLSNCKKQSARCSPRSKLDACENIF